MLDPTTQATIDHWLTGDYDDATKSDIRAMIDRGAWTELTDAFYRGLEYGTGGLRGIMGVGSNRINRYTLGMATQGLSNYLKQSFPGADNKVLAVLPQTQPDYSVCKI
jgi:phosphoglucomutase